MNPIHADAVLRKVVGLANGQPLAADPELYNLFAYFAGRILSHPESELRHVVGVFWCSAKARYPQTALLQPAVEARCLQLAWQFSPQAIANALFSYATTDLRPSLPMLQVLMMQLKAHASRFEPQATVNTLQALSRLSLQTEFREAARLLQERLIDHCQSRAITVQAASSVVTAYAASRYLPSDEECDAIMGLLHSRSEELDSHSGVTILMGLAKLHAVKQFEQCLDLLRPLLLSDTIMPQHISQLLQAFTKIEVR